MNQPFRITIEHYDQRVSVEVDHSDITTTEAVELFERALAGAGFPNVTLSIDGAADADHDAYIAAADALLGGNIAREFLDFTYKPQRGEIIEVSNDGSDWITRVFDWYDGKVYRVPMTYRDEVKMYNGHKDYLTIGFKQCRRADGELFAYI